MRLTDISLAQGPVFGKRSGCRTCGNVSAEPVLETAVRIEANGSCKGGKHGGKMGGKKGGK